MAYDSLESNAVKIITDEHVRESPQLASNRGDASGYHVDNVRDGQRGSVWKAGGTGDTTLFIQYASTFTVDCIGVFNHKNCAGLEGRFFTGQVGGWTKRVAFTVPESDFIVTIASVSQLGVLFKVFGATSAVEIGQFQVGTLFNFTYGVARPFEGHHFSNVAVSRTPAHIYHREKRARPYSRWEISMPSIQSTTRTAALNLWDDSNGPLHSVGGAFEEGTNPVVYGVDSYPNSWLYDDAILASIEDVEHIESERFLNSQWGTKLILQEIV